MVCCDTLGEALASILPVSVCDHFTQAFAPQALIDTEEELYIARVRAKRRLEFLTGRHCAQAALAKLGATAAPLGRRTDGRVRWPAGAVGSLSHSEGACVAIAARKADFASVGVDVERREILDKDVVSIIASSAEIAALPCEAFGAAAAQQLQTVLFSSKESVFKAVYPLAEYVFGFDEVRILLAVDGSFTARLQPHLASRSGLATVAGRFALTPHHVLTAAFVPARLEFAVA